MYSAKSNADIRLFEHADIIHAIANSNNSFKMLTNSCNGLSLIQYSVYIQQTIALIVGC